jgi:hypothetical protein
MNYKRKTVFGIALLVIFTLSNALFLAPVNGGTQETDMIKSSTAGLTSLSDLWEAYQQRTFYANGRFWVFYYNGSGGSHDHEVYTSSIDGTTWNKPVEAIVDPIDSSHSFSIWFDGTYVHNFASADWASILTYRRGIPNNDGTIDWKPAQTILGTPYDFTSKETFYYPQGCVDSNGYPWIAYEMCTDTLQPSYITKSSTNDGTWVNEQNFPHQMSSGNLLNGTGQGVYPLTNGKVAAIYVTSGYAYLQAWNGQKWLPQVQTNVNPGGDQYGYFSWSAVSQDDNVHFVYGTTSVNWGVGYELYNYATNSFGKETILQQDESLNWGYTVTPLTLDPRNDALYCFWINPVSNQGDGHYNQIVYKKCAAGVWDIAPTVLFNVSANNIPSPIALSAAYYAYGERLSVIYTTGLPNTPPFNINFISIPVDLSGTSTAPTQITPLSTENPFLSPVYIIILVIFVTSVIALLLQRFSSAKKLKQ